MTNAQRYIFTISCSLNHKNHWDYVSWFFLTIFFSICLLLFFVRNKKESNKSLIHKKANLLTWIYDLMGWQLTYMVLDKKLLYHPVLNALSQFSYFARIENFFLRFRCILKNWSDKCLFRYRRFLNLRLGSRVFAISNFHANYYVYIMY